MAHGPTGQQNHRKRVNKKVKRLALASALSDRAGSDAVRVVSDFGITEPRTKDAVAFLEALELTGRNVLLVLAERDDAIGKSFRNLRNVHLLTVGQLNVHDVLVSDVVVFAEAALDRIGRPGEGGRQRAGGRGSPGRAAATADDDAANADDDATEEDAA